MAQIAAETLGCEFSRIRVVQGDTEICPYGLGNYSSRATMYGGSAVQMSASDLRDKMFRVAAKMLEVDSADLEGLTASSQSAARLAGRCCSTRS